MKATRLIWLTGFGICVLGIATALATPIVFTSNPSTVFQQTTNNPCVIGNPSCNQGGFADVEWSSTPGGGNGSTYDLWSLDPAKPESLGYYSYVVGVSNVVVPPNTLPTAFSVGIDVNFATGWGDEQLVFFKVYTSATGAEGSFVLDALNSFIPDVPVVIAQQNGNGYSDAILSGFSLATGTYVRFEASVTNDSDGMEQFFVVPEGTPYVVPEPTSLVLLGTGLVILGGCARRFRKNRK